MSIREFGTRLPDAEYVFRPGAYVVLRGGGDGVAVVRTPHGVFLPGGGQAVGETPGEAALREVSEECGLEAHLLDVIGTADQFCFSEEERLYFRKRCTFFRGHIVRPCGDPEADHELLWLSSREAEVAMTHESQRWAVAEERRIANA